MSERIDSNYHEFYGDLFYQENDENRTNFWGIDH